MLCRLSTRTLDLLHNRPRWLTYEKIGKDTGLGAHWVRKFAQGKNEAGANKVETLYSYLSGKELDI